MSWFPTLSLLQLDCQVFQLTITTSLLWEFQEFSVVFQVVTCILFFTRSSGWTKQVANIPALPPKRNLMLLGMVAGLASLMLRLPTSLGLVSLE